MPHWAEPQCYVLNYDGRHGVDAARRVMPYLRRKKMKAALFIGTWGKGRFGGYSGALGWPASLWAERDRYHEKMRRLK